MEVEKMLCPLRMCSMYLREQECLGKECAAYLEKYIIDGDKTDRYGWICMMMPSAELREIQVKSEVEK